jgi:hypothetical protein
MKTLIAAVLCLASAYGNAGVITNFTGDFALSNFSQAPNGGMISTDNAPLAVALTSSNSGMPIYEWWYEPLNDVDNMDWAEITIKLKRNYFIKFNYDYLTSDVGGVMGLTYYDPFGYTVNDVFHQVSDVGPFVPSHLRGTVTLRVNAGDTFGLRAESMDSSGGSATTNISDFSAMEIPEPGSPALLGLGFFAFTVARKHSHRVWKYS